MNRPRRRPPSAEYARMLMGLLGFITALVVIDHLARCAGMGP